MSRRVMIHVQHLLGTGHLKRMALLAGALHQAGARVTLVSGGPPAPQIGIPDGVHLVQLPPVQALDESFSALSDTQGNEISDTFRKARTSLLLEAFLDASPDVLIVELFPLGRRQLRFELVPLLETARPVTGLIACSVRDIVNRRPHREAEALDWLNAWFDLLLVHGDAGLTPISDSVPGIGAFRGEVLHTGYLAAPLPDPIMPDQPEILVSAGGGRAGVKLFTAAAEASALHEGPEIWRIRHGAGLDHAMLDRLRAKAASSAILEPVAPDFPGRLGGASLSISQFGYNTAVELMQTSTPAVIVPFEGGGETEQVRRADRLATLGLEWLSEAELSTGALLSAVTRATLSQRPATTAALDGLAVSTDRILQA